MMIMIRNIIWTIALVAWTIWLLQVVLFILFIMDLTYDGGPL